MFAQTEDLKTLIAQVLEANESRCLDDTTDREAVTNALTNALVLRAVENLDVLKASLHHSLDTGEED
jgi:hypothetical protein